MKKILITGVYGLISGVLYNHLKKQSSAYELYGLDRIKRASSSAPQNRIIDIDNTRFYKADITDPNSVQQAVKNMDVVVHLAADLRPDAPWDSILSNNIIGTYNVFKACKNNGVKRVIFASSIRVVLGYEQDEPYKAIAETRFQDIPDKIPLINHLSPVRPTEPYAVSKVWGETLAKYYSDIHNLSCICLRIGWVNTKNKPYKPRDSAVWCSHRDITHLIEQCINADKNLLFDIFYGVSDNQYRWADIEHARNVVGYTPRDRATLNKKGKT